MKAQVQRWGNSLAVRIPRAVANEARLVEGCQVDMLLSGEDVILRPVTRHGYTLDELLAGITDENRHGETDWRPPVAAFESPEWDFAS